MFETQGSTFKEWYGLVNKKMEGAINSDKFSKRFWVPSNGEYITIDKSAFPYLVVFYTTIQRNIRIAPDSAVVFAPDKLPLIFDESETLNGDFWKQVDATRSLLNLRFNTLANSRVFDSRQGNVSWLGRLHGVVKVLEAVNNTTNNSANLLQ